MLELTEEQLVSEWFFDFVLDETRQGARAVRLVVALFGQIGARRLAELDGYVPIRELIAELLDELVDDPNHDRRGQRIERDPRIQTIPELGAERVAQGE